MFSEHAIRIAEYYKDKNVTKLAKTPLLVNILKQDTPFLDEKCHIYQRVWHVVNNTKNIPKCKYCDNNVKWKKIQKRYYDYCGVKCVALGTVSKKEKTCLSRYGSKNPSQVDSIRQKVEKTMIKNHGMKCNLSTNKNKTKVKETCLKKYGVEYSGAVPEKIKKTKETWFANYGTDNPFANTKIKEKIKNTNIQKYGVEHNKHRHISQESLKKTQDKSWLIDQHHNQKKSLLSIAEELGYANSSSMVVIFKRHDIEVKHFFQSAAEHEIVDYIKSIYSGEVQQGCRSIIKKQELDIYLPEKQMAIEYNGIYWHSIEQGKTKDYHLNKSILAAEKGIQLIHIFEDEWNDNKELIKNRIANLLGVDDIPGGELLIDQNNISFIDVPTAACLSKFKSFLNSNIDIREIYCYCNLRYENGLIPESLGFNFVKREGPQEYVSDGFTLYDCGYSVYKFEREVML
jgi:hypothetical protein